MDVESFAAFYRQHYRLILTVAEQRLRGHTDAEDITAEVFRIAWKHAFEGNELSLPWVYQVLRNVIGNEYRRVGRAAQFLEDAGPLLVANLVESSSEDAIEVRAAMRQLSVDDREVLYMAYWEDLSGQEIAAILDCTSVTVRVRLMRARRKLKSILDRVDVGKERTRDG